MSDAVNQPVHYTAHPSGVECIEITKHLNFCVGNAMKYLWRAGLKGDVVEDLRKARRYIDYELERLKFVDSEPVPGTEIVERRPPVPLKEWLLNKSQELGLSVNTIRRHLRQGRFLEAELRRINNRVVFVVEGRIRGS